MNIEMGHFSNNIAKLLVCLANNLLLPPIIIYGYFACTTPILSFAQCLFLLLTLLSHHSRHSCSSLTIHSYILYNVQVSHLLPIVCCYSLINDLFMKI